MQANSPNRMVAHECCAVVIELTRERPRLFGIAEPCAGLCHRQHRDGDTVLVHVFQRHLRRPFRPDAATPCAQGVAIKCQGVVMVYVDAARFGLGGNRVGQEPGGQRGAGGLRNESTPA